jgi:3-oxoacyl-[acyl-carrier-protein] synthase-3
MPPNAYLIHKHFNFRENIVAFDINQACSGFIYGLYLAKSLILSGSAASVLIINADTYSKYIHKNDRSTRALFGDGASATLISSSDSCKGIIDSLISSCGKEYQSFYIPAGGCRMPFETADKKVKEDENGNSRTDLDIYMNGMGVLSFFRNKVSVQIKELLKKHDLVVEDIDLFVFHQASKVALDSIAAALKIKQEKIYSNIKNIGNIVSASIPVALKCAMQENRIGQGHKIIISGFGVGLSWGSILIEL